MQNRKRIVKRKRRKRKKNYRRLILTRIFLLLFIISIPLLIFKFNNTKYTPKTINTYVEKRQVDKFTICLDAGHGDWDYGAIGINNSNEKDIVLSITLLVGEYLEEAGLNVVYTRTTDKLSWSDDSTQNLYERVAISKKNNSDLFLSIHCNSTDESSSYNGIETWFNPNSPESEEFAGFVQAALGAISYTEDRGTKYYSADAPLAVLNRNTATSALVELGFISNIDDEAYLTSKKGQATIATAIAKSILSYKDSL